MKKLRIIFYMLAAAGLICGVFYFRSQHLPKVKEPQSVVKLNISPTQGVVVENFKTQNWPEISNLFTQSSADGKKLENYLSQLIYSLDSAEKLVIKPPLNTEPLVTILLKTLDEDSLSQKGKILLSKTLAKLNLTPLSKDKVKQAFARKKLLKENIWLDVSVRWVPMETESIRQLKSLIVKDRTDLLSDYVYYLNQVEDKKIMKDLVRDLKNKKSLFSSDHQNFIDQQIPGLDKKVAL